MADAPQLPGSPLSALERPHTDPPLAIWRQRTLIASTGLIGAFCAGVLAFFMFWGWPSRLSELDEIAFPLVVAAPALMPGLVGLQVALARLPRAGSAVVIATLLAVAGAGGHVWFIQDLGHHQTALAIGVAGLVGEGAVIAVPVLRRTRIARPATAVAIVACILAPLALIWEMADDFFRAPDPWAAIAISMSSLVPIAGAAVLLWLLFTEPRE